MRIDGRTRLLGLVGDPVAHSLSPAIQNHALASLGVNLVYLPFQIVRPELEAFLRLFPRFGGVGLNVTTPHKEAAARAVDAGDEEVACIGGCNTIAYGEGRAVGWSTDGLGFLHWMEAHRIRPQEQEIALLGFGPTARSLAYHLGALARLTIVTRRPGEVAHHINDWQQKGWQADLPQIRSWDRAPEPGVSLVVAALPASVGGSKSVTDWVGRLASGVRLVDLNYGQGRTPLVEAAQKRKLVTFDGTGLLVHQAALSLSRWLDRRVPAELLASGVEGER